MNAEQKQRAAELLSAWRATAYALHADRMADLLQELVDAPEPEPVAYIEHHKGGDNLVWDNPGGKYSVLYTAPLVMKLSDDRIFELAESFGEFKYGDAQGCKRIEFARAIEREILGENNDTCRLYY